MESALNYVASKGESYTVKVQMTDDELKEWLKFKEGIMEDKSTDKIGATSANPCGNGNISKIGKPSCFDIDTQWLIDFGASKHMAGSYKDFYNYTLTVQISMSNLLMVPYKVLRGLEALSVLHT